MIKLKFRAWHKTDKQYIDWNCMNQTAFNRGEFMLLYDCFHNPSIVLEQFTTMHDKNGIEIYKGDICSIFLSTGQAVRSVVYFIDGCFIVKFVRPFMDRGVLRKTDYLKCYVANHAVEVIGNIHENPELLEVN